MRGRAPALGGCVVAALLAMLGGSSLAGGPNERNILVSPTSYSFGSFCVGTSSSSKTIRIENTADPDQNGELLQVSSLTRPAGQSEFAFTNPTPVTIAPGGRVNFTITFKPQSRGGRNADFTITSDDRETPQEHVLVTGTGLDRRLSSDRSSVSFGEQRVNTRSPTQNLVIRNAGGDAVTVSSVARRGANAGDFLVTAPGVPFSIPAGGSRTIAIAFQPKAAGVRNGAIEFISNACSKTKITVPFVGTGVVPNVVVEPNPVEVGSSPQGKESKPISVTVSNGGRAPLKITAIQVLGTDAADFSLQGLPVMPVTVLPAGTVTFDVRMTATAEGLRSASINVLSDDPDAPTFAVPLRGTAGAGTASPSARPTTSRPPSPSPTPSAPSTSSGAPQALARPANDSLAVGMVVGGVVFVFGGLLFIRRLVGARDED